MVLSVIAIAILITIAIYCINRREYYRGKDPYGIHPLREIIDLSKPANSSAEAYALTRTSVWFAIAICLALITTSVAVYSLLLLYNQGIHHLSDAKEIIFHILGLASCLVIVTCSRAVNGAYRYYKSEYDAL